MVFPFDDHFPLSVFSGASWLLLTTKPVFVESGSNFDDSEMQF
jgi:hypothetical protein